MFPLKTFTDKIGFRQRQLKRLYAKWTEFYGLYKLGNGKVSLLQAVRYFPQWNKSFLPGRGPLADGKPWIVYEAFEFLEKIIEPNMRVFEFGSGGSSAYFARKTKSVHSIEHDEQWLEYTRDEILKAGRTNWTGSWYPPVKDENFEAKQVLNPAHYISSWPDFSQYEFSQYASAIDSYPEAFFDIVFIDGRVRPSCFIHAKDKVKPGGYLGLDNSERERYQVIHNSLDNEGWEKFNFFGVGPYVNYEFWQTSFWRRPISME